MKPATETVGRANLPPERFANGELGVNLKGIELCSHTSTRQRENADAQFAQNENSAAA